ncbi:hypothetical protein [Streptomyces sp. NPDC001340]
MDDMLAATGATARFGGQDLHLSSRRFEGSASVSEPDGLPVACQANGIGITIETSAGSEDPLGASVGSAEEDSAIPVPLGQGWSGYLAGDDERLGVFVLLDCANWKPSQGGGILVSLDASAEGISDAERARFARITADTAKNAAEKAGCHATPGRTIRQVDRPSAIARVGAGQARGTCAGTRSQPSVTETPARTSPVEYCLLGDSLRLTAAYGPFVNPEDVNGNGPYAGFDKPAGAKGLLTWATATCSGAQATALYTAVPAQKSDRNSVSQPLNSQELSDLKQFAAQSAARHHCSAPVVP